MAYKYKLREEEGAEVSPSNREQVTYDVVVTPKDVSIEDTVKALETLSNYGMYVSNLRKEQAIEDRYGPTIPTSKKKLESIFQDVQNTFKNEEEAYDEFIKQALAQNKNIKNLNIKYNTLKSNNGYFYPKNSNTEMQDYIKSLTSRPTLLKYKVKDDTIVFPKSGNPAKDLTKKMIDVVMKNAKIDYSVADKEAVDEAKKETGVDMAKKQLDALGVKYEMSTTDKVRPFKVIYQPINKSDEFYDKFEDIVDLFNLKGVVKSSMNEDKLDQEAKVYFMQQVKLGKIKELPKDPKAEYMKIKMTKEELKEVIREQIKSLIK
jgi:hypothetical protein